ncbi:hypothetical protein QTP88_003976 [Uroleucon formosanum]
MQKHRGIMNTFVTISKNEDIEITENPKQSSSPYLDNTPNIILNDDIEVTENLKQSSSLYLDNTPNIFNIDENSTKNHILESNNKFIGKNVIARTNMDYEFLKTLQNDGSKRKFTKSLYTRNLINGEKTDRVWLVYSITKNCVFCYNCKLCSSENPHLNHLSTIGTNDWKHLPEKLITHERSVQHFKSIEA